MIRNYKKSDIIVFLVSVGNNPIIFETIDRYKKYMPPHQLIVWNDCSSKEYAEKVEKECDILINNNINFGITKAIGFAFLYLEYDYLLFASNDMIISENTWEIMSAPFSDPKVGIVGDEWRTKFEGAKESNPTCFPDGIFIVRKELINDIGSISPAFGRYAHQTVEFMDRAYKNGWKVATVNANIQHIGRKGIEEIIADTGQEEFNESLERSERAIAVERKQWWADI